jgi:hypothetical protein
MMQLGRKRRFSTFGVLVLASLVLSGCVSQAQEIMTLATAQLNPKAPEAVTTNLVGNPVQPQVELPAEQIATTYAWEPLGTADRGRQQFRVRILSGGSPGEVAIDRLTPLFSVNGKSAADYVSEQFFAQNPNRKANTIQPGDEFTLTVPADAFVVRAQQDLDERLGQPAKVREFVSTRGDVLRFYLTDPFPITYELQSAGNPGHGQLHLSKDLAFLLRTGRTNPTALAQLIYRVPDPDIYQVEAVRNLAASTQLGVEQVLDMDRSRAHLDPVRDAMDHAYVTNRVAEPERSQLTRFLLPQGEGIPYMAVEDVLGTRTSLDGLPAGKVFRITYDWDGTVRVYYVTGPDDSRGKRDPFALREDERWAALYEQLQPDADTPVKWSAGEASDLDPFPSARDPRQKDPSPAHAYDFLLSGRVLVLTFHPTRTKSDVQAEERFRNVMLDARDTYKEQINQALQVVDYLHLRNADDSSQTSAPDTAGGDASDES